LSIVVLDHVYLQREHIKELRSLGSLKVFKEPPKTLDDLRRRISEASVVIVGWTRLTRDAIKSATKLRMISIWATSCHYADVQAAKEAGIVVSHVPGYATEAVSEHAFALLLASARRLLCADRHVRKGGFDWRPFGGIELRGKTLGVVGTGLIGCRVAEISKAFEMQILGYDKCPNVGEAEELGIKYVDLHTLLKKSDFVTLHLTLTPETERLIGKKEFEVMKNGAVLINTSQGKVIDERALIEALKSGRVSYAGLDVFEEEPPPKDNALFELNNTVLTPHVGFHTIEAVKRCSDICIDNVVKFLEGQPQNLC
jgi:phosphoglycerate dehydrogenase-like enzyme